MIHSIDCLKLNGKYTKLLKAYAQLFGLVHSVEVDFPAYLLGMSLVLDVYVKTAFYISVLDVFKKGQVAYVSNMREYTSDVVEDTIEELSKKILLGTFGEGRYIASMKGGDCVRFVGNGQYEPVPKFYLYDIPRSEAELQIRLASAGIDWQKCTIQIRKREKHA